MIDDDDDTGTISMLFPILMTMMAQIMLMETMRITMQMLTLSLATMHPTQVAIVAELDPTTTRPCCNHRLAAVGWAAKGDSAAQKVVSLSQARNLDARTAASTIRWASSAEVETGEGR